MSQTVEIVSNLRPILFGLKVRTRGPQPSICVRTLSLFTTTKTLNTFCDALKRDDYHTAYNQFSSEYQKSTVGSEAQWDTYISSRSTTDCMVTNVNDAAGTGTISYNGGTAVWDYMLVNENGTWKINYAKQRPSAKGGEVRLAPLVPVIWTYLDATATAQANATAIAIANPYGAGVSLKINDPLDCINAINGIIYMPQPIVLSYVQVEPLLKAKKQEQTTVEISPDLGLTTITVRLSPEGVVFPHGERLDWRSIEKIRKSEVNCFILENSTIRPIQVFSEYTNRLCSLMPTRGVPSMLIAGFVMHRIKDIDPMQDTLRKIAAISPVVGRVLDTSTGLGYTAIEASKTANEVVTIELDPAVQEIARLNPWSQALFNNLKIHQIMGDACEVVQTFEDESFSRVIHDPPTFSLGGELYSGAFYQQLYRVLKRGGRLFHYIGDPHSKASGGVTRGVLRRLQEAGFTRVVRRPDAYGVVGYK
jgi:predicted methyltransferase